MWRHIASNALSLLFVLLVVAVGVVTWARREFVAEGPLQEATCIAVPPGSTMYSLSLSLSERGVIERPSLFRVGADYLDKTGDLKAGNFRIPPRVSMAEIVDTVTASGQSTCGSEIVYLVGVTEAEIRVRELDPAANRFETKAEFAPGEEAPEAYEEARQEDGTRYRVSLAEGVTSWQAVEALRSFDILAGDVAEVPPEGSLAPESYEVQPGQERSNVLARMQELQKERLNEAWEGRPDGTPLETAEELLILASIIEKETGIPEERPLVASVFVNRLQEGMRLQTDPTVIYGITNGQSVLGRGLRRSELQQATPYNTYLIDGLPPTPIANPGIESLRAALEPAQSDFLFFVADGSGGHAFAKTLQEHEENVARWREIEGEGRAQN